MDDDKQNQPAEPAEPAQPAQPAQPHHVPPAAPPAAAPPPAASPPVAPPPAASPAESPRPIIMTQAPPRRRSIIGPLILILLGVGFLLSNLGIVTWNIWELMVRLWPLWLVAAGVDLLFGRSRWGSWVGVGLLLALIGGAGWFAQGTWGPLAGQVSPAESFSQPLTGAHRADINLHVSVGQLIVRESSNAALLAEGQISTRPGERILRDYSVSGDTAHFDLESRQQGFNPFFGVDRSAGLWDVALSTQVPLSLNIGTGVGKAEIDLSRLQVTDLRVQSGVGATTITVPAQNQLRARIDSGVGATTIRVPRGMAVRITAQTGIGNLNLPGGYGRQGSAWVSGNYDSAQNRAELDIHGGVGVINIEEGN